MFDQNPFKNFKEQFTFSGPTQESPMTDGFILPGVTSGADYVCVGYRGSSPYDAGMFYCPYVPLQMVRAVSENTFQPKIGFKTRYGLVNNPFVSGNGIGNVADKSDPHNINARRANQYYRIFRVLNLHGNT